jgi:Ca2+-binding EF-hand superfamily protein
VLQQVQEKSGRDTASIFSEIVDPVKQSIEIKKFVAAITKHDQSFDQNLLYKTCWVLDRDNCGAISLDDFISLNEQVAQEAEEENQAKADQELQDAIWPEWVIKEGKMEQA